MNTEGQALLLTVVAILSVIQSSQKDGPSTSGDDIILDNMERNSRSSVHINNFMSPTLAFIRKFPGLFAVEGMINKWSNDLADSFRRQLSVQNAAPNKNPYELVTMRKTGSPQLPLVNANTSPKVSNQSPSLSHNGNGGVVAHHRPRKDLGRHGSKHRWTRKRIHHPNHKGTKNDKTSAGQKRMVSLESVSERCRRQFSPDCNTFMATPLCFGGNCNRPGPGDIPLSGVGLPAVGLQGVGFPGVGFPGAGFSGAGTSGAGLSGVGPSGAGGCPPGMANCFFRPLVPVSGLNGANGLLIVPRVCPPESPQCNEVTQSYTTAQPSSPPPPSPPMTPPALLSVNQSPPLHLVASGNTGPTSLAHNHPTIELSIRTSPKQGGHSPTGCEPDADVEDTEKCLILQGKKYRLVPYDETAVPSAITSYTEQPQMVSQPIVYGPGQLSFPVPEDCLVTLKDMDFGRESLRSPSRCQRAVIRVILNLGRNLDGMRRDLSQINNYGACSLQPGDAKLIARAVHQLLINGCCSPTGGSTIKLGGGCTK